MTRINQLADLITKANDSYYNGIATITDEQYDAWKDELRSLDPAHELLFAIGAEAPDQSHWRKRKHSIPMSSLDKVNSIEQFKKWYSDKKVKSICLQEKLDGLSLSLDYEQGSLIAATTRGSGVLGEDILRNILKIPNIPQTIYVAGFGVNGFTGSIRGELILTRSAWKAYFPEISNPRNGASGIARRLDGSGAERLSFLAYDIIADDLDVNEETEKLKFINSLGFKTPAYYLAESVDEVLAIRDQYINTTRSIIDYDIDGLVLKINSLIDQALLGRSSGLATGNPNGQIAFKFANELRETEITKVVWEVGATGRVTPVAEFNKVNLDGAYIARASLYNYRNVQTLGVSAGAKVLVSRRNQIIPAVEQVLIAGTEPVIIPKDCPVCNQTLNIDGEYLTCINTECSAVILGNVQKWIDNVGIDNLGPQILETLYNAGLVKTIPDLYKLDINALSKLDRLGDKSAQKIIRNINAKKQMPLHIFLGSMNIPGCGRRVFESLVEQGYDTVDYILSLLPAHFEQVDGIGPKTAMDIYFGLQSRRQLVADLLALGVTIGDFLDANAPVVAPINNNFTGSLKGLSFCFTGAMSQPRSVLSSYVLQAGGLVKDVVNKSLNYLVLADSSTVKAQKARSMGVKTIDEAEFLKMVGK